MFWQSNAKKYVTALLTGVTQSVGFFAKMNLAVVDYCK